MDVQKIRNIAIIAHVDHGKTTLVDKLLRQSGTLDRNEIGQERVMDSNDIEKERGITILSKRTQLSIGMDASALLLIPQVTLTLVVEVERVMSMVDSVLLLVDAVDGPISTNTICYSKSIRSWIKTYRCY